MNNAPDRDPLPIAGTRPLRPRGWLWLLPALATMGALVLTYLAWTERGIPVLIEFRHGHGLKEGDALRYRGIEIGWVRRVRLTDDFRRVLVELRLDPSAQEVARSESRFWIVRAEVGPGGAAGLETLIGANYLSVLPGEGEPRTRFVGLESAPILETMEPGGVRFVLSARRRGNLRPGALIRYRQVFVGKVLSVALARDARAVEVDAYVEPAYAHLVREGTRFWKTAGARIDADLFSGLSLQIDSVQALLAGGVTLAIPPNPGPAVASGHRFVLHDEPQPDWLDWTPNIALHGASGGDGRPQPLAVQARWRADSYLTPWRSGKRSGWLLPLKAGLLGPINLLTAPAGAKAGSLQLVVDGEVVTIDEPTARLSADLGLLDHRHQRPVWPAERMRYAPRPEDTLIVSGSATPPRFIAAEGYHAEGRRWRIVASDSPALAFTGEWNGAPVVSAADGDVIGLLVAEQDRVWVAPWPRRHPPPPE